MSGTATAEMNAWIARVLGIKLPMTAHRADSDAPAIEPEALGRLGAAAAGLTLRPSGPPPSVRTDSLIGRAVSQPLPAEPKKLLEQIGQLAPEFVVTVQEETPSSSTALREGMDLPRQDWMLEFGDRYNSLLRDLRDWGLVLADAQRARDIAAGVGGTAPEQQGDLIEAYATARAECLDTQARVMTGLRTFAAEFRQAQAQQSAD